MKKYLTAFIIAIVTCFTSGAESKYMSLVDDADKAIKAEDYTKAIALLTEALRLEPDNSGNVMLLSNLGMLHYYTGNDSLAIGALSLAHEMAPESITILTNRAKVLTDARHYREAMRDYDAIISLDSTLFKPYLEKGVIYLILGDTNNAETNLGILKEKTDVIKSLECSAALAWLASMKNDNAEAMKYYSALIELSPTADFYAARALCHITNEDYPDASIDISDGMKLDPECGELYLARASLNKHTYRNDDAMNDAQRAIELGIDPRRVRALLGL